MIRLVRYGAKVGPTRCRLCGAEIVWALTDHNRRMPMDPGPAPGGHWILCWYPDEEPEPVQRVVYFRDGSPGWPEAEAGTELRWRPHWGSCPQRDAAHHLAERHERERPTTQLNLFSFSGGEP